MKYKSILMLVCVSGMVQAASQNWKEECVGYYKMQMPPNLEVALYPVDGLINTKRRPESERQGFFWPHITFGDNYRFGAENADSTQAQFSVFRFNNYNILISTKKENINLERYIKKSEEIIDFRIKDWREQIRKGASDTISDDDFKRYTEYRIKKYESAFSINEAGYYSLNINASQRLYSFQTETDPLPENKIKTADETVIKMEPITQSLMKHFRPRELFEVPSEQGFCLPYGFIAGDSGQTPHEMGVTYRLIDHPDVTIFFLDFGVNKERRTDKYSMKDAMTRMWQNSYLMGAYEKELLSPQWQHIEMDGREGMATFVKATYNNYPTYDYNGHVKEYNNYIDYGYLAYVRGDKETRNKKPDLLLYISQDSSQAKNKQPMSKDELFDIAEHITRSVTRR
ncbi:hypothetical protein GCB14_20545 [Salmonella enterica]|nr:hypothetical protein [Salmonella enterica]